MSNGRAEKKNSLLLEINNLKYQAKMERFGELFYTLQSIETSRWIQNLEIIRANKTYKEPNWELGLGTPSLYSGVIKHHTVQKYEWKIIFFIWERTQGILFFAT